MSYLAVDKINSFYGDSHILFDVTMRLEQKEVVALLGRNGAGKSTTLKSLVGLVDTQSGSIQIEGQELRGAKPHKVANAGVQLVPEERRIFGALNVEENIVLAGLTAKPAWPLERVYDMFPRLKERRTSRGTDLSGGEQQMLAIARALTRSPKVLLLDEPFEGLAPIIVRDLLAICERLAAEGQTIIIVEQNIAAALSIASRAYILNNGHVVFDGTSTDLKASPEILARYVGV
jgi:branched-chain amino acid transport system ATP-binding protein